MSDANAHHAEIYIAKYKIDVIPENHWLIDQKVYDRVKGLRVRSVVEIVQRTKTFSHPDLSKGWYIKWFHYHITDDIKAISLYDVLEKDEDTNFKTLLDKYSFELPVAFSYAKTFAQVALKEIEEEFLRCLKTKEADPDAHVGFVCQGHNMMFL